MTEAERERVFSAVRDGVLAALPEALAIYVYGSVARGDELATSDVDAAVLLPHGKRIDDPLALTAAIAERVKREVDVVDLEDAGDVLRGEVLRDGVVVFARDTNFLLSWETTALSRYVRHREETRELLEEFSRTGIGYRR